MGFNEKMNELAEKNSKIDANSTARKRLLQIFDEGTFVELDAFLNLDEQGLGVITGYGLIDGNSAYAYSQDVTVDSGAVSVLHANKIKKVYELALKTGVPIISVFDSKGAKLSEGSQMLNAYSEILMISNNISGVVPQISLVLGTCAGVSAMIAASADFMLVVKDVSQIFLNAPCNTKVEGAGSAQDAAKNGVASLLCDDEAEAILWGRNLVRMLPQNNLCSTPWLGEFTPIVPEIDVNDCPKKYIYQIADQDSVIEFFPHYARSFYIFLGTMESQTVAFIVTSKNNPIDSAGCEKMIRFVKTCDAFNIPIVTFVDTPGFDKDAPISVVRDMARLASAYAEATTVKISIITGRAYGAVYVALGAKNANADITIAWPQAQISALSPDATVEFLPEWTEKLANSSHDKLVEEFIDKEASPFVVANQGFIEKIIAPNDTRTCLIEVLDMLISKRESKLPKKHNTL